MGKFASNDVLDAALAVVAGTNRMLLLAGQPATYAAAVDGALAEAAMAPADFSLATGSAGTRRLSVAARTGLVAQAAGTADHVALVDGVGQRLIGQIPVASAAAAPATLVVRFRAGIGTDWNGVPEPLRAGIVRLVSHLFSHRDAADAGPPPAAVAALWRPWRRMQLG